MSIAVYMQERRAASRAQYPEYWASVDAGAARARLSVEFVRSRYRAPWYGIIQKRTKRKGCGDLCVIRVVRDRRGNWVRKSWLVTLDEYWLVPCTPWPPDPDAPYNMDIPVALKDERFDAAKETVLLRAERKKMRRQLRGFE